MWFSASLYSKCTIFTVNLCTLWSLALVKNSRNNINNGRVQVISCDFVKIDSENENYLKRIRKPPLLLGQEKSLAEKVKKYPCLFDKSRFSKIFLTQNLRYFFTFWLLLLEVLKQKQLHVKLFFVHLDFS